MSGETQGFVVDPEELLQVAQDVQALLDDVSGANGNIAGNASDFAMNAETSNVANALASLFPGNAPSSAYVEAYRYEYQGMQEKYNSIIAQLTELQGACRTVAEAYGTEDDVTRAGIDTIDPGPGGNGPSDRPAGA